MKISISSVQKKWQKAIENKHKHKQTKEVIETKTFNFLQNISRRDSLTDTRIGKLQGWGTGVFFLGIYNMEG